MSWLLTLIAILHAALLLVVGALALVAAGGPLLEFGAAWQWFETGVYPAPLLGTVFPGLTEGAASLLAQLALTKPWLVPAVRRVLMDGVLGMHVGLLGLFLGFGVLWLLVGVEAWIADLTKHVHARTRA